MADRYELVPEPTGTWAIFDRVLDIPTDHLGRVLVGLNRSEAECLLAAGISPLPLDLAPHAYRQMARWNDRPAPP